MPKQKMSKKDKTNSTKQVQTKNSEKKSSDEKTLRWEIGVPILTNRFIMTQLAFAFGIPVIIIIAIVFAVSNWNGSLLIKTLFYALIAVVLLLLVSALIILAIYGNRSYSIFEINEKGIKQYPAKKTEKKNVIVNTILFLAGIFLAKPGYMGTALTANSTNYASIKWKDISKLKFYPKQKAIMVKNKWRTVLVVYCTEENYNEIYRYMSNKFSDVHEK